MAAGIHIKRVYEDPVKADGHRVLVDHLWPRGVSRERANVQEWARQLAPSPQLRKWFAHQPSRFAEFRERYRQELEGQDDGLAELRRRARREAVTLVYAARDREHNNAVVLAELLQDR